MPGAREEFSQIFRSSPTNLINFWLGGLPVTPRGFADVGSEIYAGNIRLLRSRSLPPDVGAEYRWRHNTLVVCDNMRLVLGSISGRALVVHEGVHAMIDRNLAVATTILTAEAAAYMAQIIYRLRSGESLRPWIEAQQANPDGAIFYQALQLIDRYGLLSGSATIPWTESAALRTAINQHPRYRTVGTADLHGADGVD